jgi:septal ring factor EnvC (AmiA/AmiB activator)
VCGKKSLSGWYVWALASLFFLVGTLPVYSEELETRDPSTMTSSELVTEAKALCSTLKQDSKTRKDELEKSTMDLAESIKAQQSSETKSEALEKEVSGLRNECAGLRLDLALMKTDLDDLNLSLKNSNDASDREVARERNNRRTAEMISRILGTACVATTIVAIVEAIIISIKG